MSRKKKLLLNIVTGIVKQVITVICGFVLPRYMLLYYGSSANGLVSSIAHFLSFISLLDMGVGAVVQANLYKPLADRDNDQISRIIISSERFFRRLALIFIVYIAILCVAFPLLVDYGTLYTISLLVIISVSTLAQYLFGISYQLLLNADQKSYIQLTIQIVTILLNTIISIVLMKAGASLHIVKLLASIVFIMRPLVQMLYVRKHYNLNTKIKVEGEPIKQKWNGLSQHLAAVICQNIDVTVLTFFSTLENISVYTVYYNVTEGLQQIILTSSNGLESLWGNIIAKQENEKMLNSFNYIEWAIHMVVTIIFTCAAITIVPFVAVYTKGVTDVDYIQPVFGMIMVSAYAARCLRMPYFCLIKAAGHFKQTQNGAYISAIINIAVTVSLVMRYGLVGVAIGTFGAMAYHTVYFVWYLRKSILHRSARKFLEYILTDAFVAIVSYFVTRSFVNICTSYFEWSLLALKVLIYVLSISCCINAIAYWKFVRHSFDIIVQRKKHI